MVSICLCALHVMHARVLPAQRGAPRPAGAFATVRGLVFDSLGGAPLSGAVIAYDGSARTATTDAFGRFAMDSVPLGFRVFNVQHAAFDSAGLAGATQRVTVRASTPSLTFAVPSFGTFWREACGTAPAPAYGALIYGVVRDLNTFDGAADYAVDVSWTGPKATANRIGGTSNARGAFALCGVPGANWLTLRAGTPHAYSSTFSLAPSPLRVRRRDLMVFRSTTMWAPRTGEEAAAAHAALFRAPAGTVVGLVTTSAQIPLADAIVTVDSIDLRTDANGRFALHDVPPGRHSVAVQAIGYRDHRVTVRVSANMTARVTVPMQRMAATPAPARPTGPRPPR